MFWMRHINNVNDQVEIWLLQTTPRFLSGVIFVVDFRQQSCRFCCQYRVLCVNNVVTIENNKHIFLLDQIGIESRLYPGGNAVFFL